MSSAASGEVPGVQQQCPDVGARVALLFSRSSDRLATLFYTTSRPGARAAFGDKAASRVNGVQERAGTVHIRVLGVALTIAFGSVCASCLMGRSVKDQQVSAAIASSRRMPDGKQWTTENLNVDTAPSYCYEDAELNCRRYGRLYTWESAQQGCHSLGGGWRLPTDDEWRDMAKHYGGVREDSEDSGNAAYKALSVGGSSGFNALLAGGRSADGQYARVNAHGFYWTASDSNRTTAWFYNFGRGGQALNRQIGGEKQMAVSVRCVRE
jgi:uncharacterized protein (TIGR02145 family)